MEENTNFDKIDIAALLKGWPNGTQLYSPLCGECQLEDAGNISKIVVKDNDGRRWTFNPYGEVADSGERLLFPSRHIRDWNHFRVAYTVPRSSMSDGERRQAVSLLEAAGGRVSDDCPLPADPSYIWYVESVNRVIRAVRRDEKPCGQYILETGHRIPDTEIAAVTEVCAYGDRALVRYTDGLGNICLSSSPKDADLPAELRKQAAELLRRTAEILDPKIPRNEKTHSHSQKG